MYDRAYNRHINPPAVIVQCLFSGIISIHRVTVYLHLFCDIVSYTEN